MERKRRDWWFGRGASLVAAPPVLVLLVAVSLVVGSALAGCGDPGPEQETNPRCHDGPPRGAFVQHLDDGRIIEDDTMQLEDSDTVFVGEVVEADLLPDDPDCVNRTMVNRRMTVRVDEVLFGEPIEGEVVVDVEDSRMALPIEFGRHDVLSTAIFFVRKTDTPGVWLARGPEHLDYETYFVDRWRAKIAEFEENLEAGVYRNTRHTDVPSGTAP